MSTEAETDSGRKPAGEKRIDGREPGDLRPISFETGFQPFPEGSVLVSWGSSRIICSVSAEERVPPFLIGKGRGWVTAEYDMLPGSGNRRIRRDRVTGGVRGRSHEIQRLIGRSLRQCMDMTKLGERTLIVDCDVLVADGGTRVASITGGTVALRLATRALMEKGRLKEDPFLEYVAAVSVGLIDGEPLVDLCYEEDSAADVDLNIVATESGEIVELQATSEQATTPLDALERMSRAGLEAITGRIVPLQVEAADQ
jgi:ribonuclease PH